MAQLVKNLPAMWETWVGSLGWEDPLEKGKATHSSIMAWRILWTVQSMGSQRVGHDSVPFTSLHFTSLPGGSVVKNLPAMPETWVPFLGWEDPLEIEMATYSSILAWEIPWTEELGEPKELNTKRK